MNLPLTLTMAAAAGLINIWLAIRIGQVRTSQKVSVGDGGNEFVIRRMRAQANFVDIDNRGANRAVKITGTPDEIYRLRADWNFAPQWRLRLDAQHESDRDSNSTGTRVADSFTVANAFLRFSPLTSVGIDLGVRNLTDELYAYDEGYYEAGRSWLAQVDYRY